MKYELALELKKAGFPQEGSGYYLDQPDGLRLPRSAYNPKHDTYIPTLEQLIEACGEKFRALLFIGKGVHTGEPWVAHGEEGIRTGGMTPTSAVAKLWLSLNKPI